MSPMLTNILALIARLKSGGSPAKVIAETVRDVVNGPLLGLAVMLTPNKADDAVLEMLKALFPAATRVTAELPIP